MAMATTTTTGPPAGLAICDRKTTGGITGWRATVYYPNGSTYRGHWEASNHHGYGELQTKRGFVYQGYWRASKRHGAGCVRKVLPNGEEERIYIGDWQDDRKCGLGKQFYATGVYHGYYKMNHRQGPGQMVYNDGSEYFGLWKSDVPHGIGVFFYANGNRYEGYFARGMKNGEGTFFHTHTGQLQKGMWENGVCKTSLMLDGELRQRGDTPTEYAIPPVGLAMPDQFVYQCFKDYIRNKKKPTRSVFEKICLSWIHKRKEYAIYQKFPVTKSKVPFDDVFYPCVCKNREKLMILRSRQ